MTVITSIADLRELARRRVPRAMFDYADRGSYDEITIRRNRADLEAILASPEGQATIADVPNFASGGVTFMFDDEVVLIPCSLES